MFYAGTSCQGTINGATQVTEASAGVNSNGISLSGTVAAGDPSGGYEGSSVHLDEQVVVVGSGTGTGYMVLVVEGASLHGSASMLLGASGCAPYDLSCAYSQDPSGASVCTTGYTHSTFCNLIMPFQNGVPFRFDMWGEGGDDQLDGWSFANLKIDSLEIFTTLPTGCPPECWTASSLPYSGGIFDPSAIVIPTATPEPRTALLLLGGLAGLVLGRFRR